MRYTYFFAGNTPYIKGANQQFYGTFTYVGSPGDAVCYIINYKAEELGVEYKDILLTCFNDIGEVGE